MELLRISQNGRFALHGDYKLWFRDGDNAYLAMIQWMVYLDQVPRDPKLIKGRFQFILCSELDK